ncbi:MAG: copper chaperone [Gaiellales bacterium]|nr:copper chaperone [Gaiellales bacterium]
MASETLTLAVRGMSCGGCEQRVQRAVTALPGVDGVVAEHIGDEVEVTYDPGRVDISAIESAIAALGFTIVEASS